MAGMRRASDGLVNDFLCILLWAVPACCGVAIRGQQGSSLVLPCRSLDEVAVWTKANWTILGVFHTINIPESPWHGTVSVAGSVNLRINSLDPERDDGEFVCTTDIGKQIVMVHVHRRSTVALTTGKQRPVVPPHRDTDGSVPADHEPDSPESGAMPRAGGPTFSWWPLARRPIASSSPPPRRPIASSSPPAGLPTGSSTPVQIDSSLPTATESGNSIPDSTTESVLIVLGVTLGVFFVTVLLVIGVVSCCFRRRSQSKRQETKRPALDTELRQSRQGVGQIVAPTYTHLWTDRDGYLAPAASPGNTAATYTQLRTSGNSYLTPVTPAIRNTGKASEVNLPRPTSSRVYEEIIG